MISTWYLVALAWALALSLAALVYALWPAREIPQWERPPMPARHAAPPVCPEADSDDQLSSDLD